MSGIATIASESSRGRRRRLNEVGRAFETLVRGGTIAMLAMVAAPGITAAATITVNTLNQEINGDGFCSLQEAIYAANLDDNVAPDAANPGEFFDTACPGGSGHDVIEMPPMGVFTFTQPIDDWDNFIGPTVTPIITTDITIEGRGAKLELLAAGSVPTRAFAVAPTGFLDLREVHIKGFSILGGDGGAGGGGGGMGAGGAIYVQGGRLLVQWTTFEGNSVRGGDGGDNTPSGGGGGGGLSGDGGRGDFSGGGGGGSRGDGGDGDFNGQDYRGGGGGGRVTSGVDEHPGEPCGGEGGVSTFLLADDGSLPTCSGGGGGGGSGHSDITSGNGATGFYGAGGGGGGGGGDGGDGSFGGGGGGGGQGFTFTGGDGGFGGGGGRDDGIGLSDGQGGTFAGDGGYFTGGGGAGLGGAIFGYLADIRVSNSTFVGNLAAQGKSGITCGLESCGPEANDGRGAGGAIFTVAGDLRVESSTFADNATTTVTNGGGGAIVVYDPEGDDEATLVLRNTIIANNGASECYTRNGVTTSGSEGNIITNSALNNLGNPACPGVIGSDDPGLAPLTRAPTERVATMAIGPTSPAINVAVGTVGVDIPLDDQRGVLRPQGLAADVGAYEYEIPAPVPPVTTIALTPSSPNGTNGWYGSNVGVSITASDLDDAVAQTRCALNPASTPASFDDLPDAACGLTSIDADGMHAIYAASVDAAGNLETPVVSKTLQRDATKPTLAPTLNVTIVAVGQTGVVASPNATDNLSGVASSSCGTVSTATPGPNTVTCTATDNAGNTATATLSYLVEYKILGFFSPVPFSRWRLRTTVPIKVALGNHLDTRIDDATGAALAAGCWVTFTATGAQSKTDECLKYDPLMDQFVYNWRLAKSGTGMATIAVSVGYPGTSTKTTLSEPIVITR